MSINENASPCHNIIWPTDVVDQVIVYPTQEWNPRPNFNPLLCRDIDKTNYSKENVDSGNDDILNFAQETGEGWVRVLVSVWVPVSVWVLASAELNLAMSGNLGRARSVPPLLSCHMTSNTTTWSSSQVAALGSGKSGSKNNAMATIPPEVLK